ncbi:MBL fold metallo-hydrolase [Paraflavisolibacter sp. H34]|uniref:MBL fold metallo-hydrolase n=1 Tax=Huijunlia imazamoxiresistens TaxID=3127457 RepID=UPI00301B5EC0
MSHKAKTGLPKPGTIIPLSEGSFTIDKTKLFVPFNPEEDDLQQRPVGSLLVEVQPFLVVTSQDVLVLDAGLGFLENGTDTMQLHANLARAGVQPEQVTKVLMTHLHKDHAGGICMESDHNRLSFPNATYYIQQRELDFAFKTGFPSFIPDELRALAMSPQVAFLHADEGYIDDYIYYQHTGGHSPYHQAFWIREDGQTIFFGGDEAPQLQQMKIRYKTKYDHNPDRALQLRQQWWQQGKEEGWTFLFYHDIQNPVVTQ